MTRTKKSVKFSKNMDDDNNILKYMLLAIDTEKKGIKFYTDAKNKVSDLNMTQLINVILEQEKIHLKFFTQIYNTEKKKGTLQAAKLATTYKKQPKIKNPLFGKKQLREVSRKNTISNLFINAVDFEQKGHDLYIDFAAKIKNTKIKKFLIMVANEELLHQEFIKMHQEAIYNNGYWAGIEHTRLET